MSTSVSVQGTRITMIVFLILCLVCAASCGMRKPDPQRQARVQK